MLQLKNMGPIAFRKYIKDKKVYIFGAGRALESCMDLYCRECVISGIVDNNDSLWGKWIEHNDIQIPIMRTNEFVQRLVNKEELENSVLFVSSPFYAVEIIEKLDKISELDGLECFLQVLIRNTKEESSKFEFSNGENKIPKKLHYIWVGGKPLPYEFERNIETWRMHNPDYEIICWNEKNYDFGKCDYIREAYEYKQWGFVPNYARLDIVYEHGGIYLDTDVEVVKNLDYLLKDEVFMNMGYADRVNQGCGFGAISGHSMIFDMAQAFRESRFLSKEGYPEKKPCHTFVHPILKKYGFEIENRYQKKDGMVLYPCEVMSPLTIEGMEDYMSEKTLSIHKEAGTWKNEKEKNGMDKLVDLIKSERL